MSTHTTGNIRGEDENRDLGFGAVVARESRQRLLNRDGSFNVSREGLSLRASLSLRHTLLTRMIGQVTSRDINRRALVKSITVGFFFAFALLIGDTAQAQWKLQQSGTSADFRGLSAVSSSVAWASGTNGTFARTTDGGATWHAGTVAGATALDFRDVDAFDANTAYLLSIGNGDSSRIYKTTDGGKRWQLQFTNSKPDAFFDAMAFWDRDHGIAFSDPVGGRFIVVTTGDGGATWEQIPAENIPAAITGEGGFAASGTCITVQGKNNVWFATGGMAARVFRSTDRGKTWAVAPTPVISGIQSAGIFSIAFKDARNGVVVGGNYQKPNEATRSVATTTDGGRTWGLVAGSLPSGYRSSVAYVPRSGGSTLVAVGTSGSDISVDGGINWTSLDKENYNSVSFGGAVWAAGPAGLIAKLAGVLPGTRNRARVVSLKEFSPKHQLYP